MNLHEYQSKQLLARYGIPVPDGHPATSGAQARERAPDDPRQERGPQRATDQAELGEALDPVVVRVELERARELYQARVANYAPLWAQARLVDDLSVLSFVVERTSPDGHTTTLRLTGLPEGQYTVSAGRDILPLAVEDSCECAVALPLDDPRTAVAVERR